jgi:hypothetical protein
VQARESSAHAIQAEQLVVVVGFGQPVGVAQHPRAGRRALRTLHDSGVRADSEWRSLRRRDQLVTVIQPERGGMAGVGPAHDLPARKERDAGDGDELDADMLRILVVLALVGGTPSS